MTEEKSIFIPITPDIVSNIQKDALSLHSTFWINKSKAKEVHVIMSTNYIALCEQAPSDLKYLYFAKIDFDLKF